MVPARLPRPPSRAIPAAIKKNLFGLRSGTRLVQFAPAASGVNTGGMYRYSRNPMYVAYFVCFLGMALLSRSAAFLVILALFQISCHWIILAEERWCIETFSAAYLDYMRTVRRYL